MKEKIIYLVIPCYNEEEVITETSGRLKTIMDEMTEENFISALSKIVFVNDGSRDHTWDIIKKLNESDQIFAGVNLTRNCGHQNALVAGLETVKEQCDAAISLDADLQDDIRAIRSFIEKFYEGSEIVYGVRSSRKKDCFFKRFTAEAFYKLQKAMGVSIIENHADYRLLGQRALKDLSLYKEVNLYLRGIVPRLGYKTDVVLYERNERFAGKSKYPLKKMISFAIDGITSFTVKPIRLISALGIALFAGSLGMMLYFLILYFNRELIPGWATLIISIWGMGGLQLLGIGILGEYIGKIYMETKARPRYAISESVGLERK